MGNFATKYVQPFVRTVYWCSKFLQALNKNLSLTRQKAQLSTCFENTFGTRRCSSLTAEVSRTSRSAILRRVPTPGQTGEVPSFTRLWTLHNMNWNSLSSSFKSPRACNFFPHFVLDAFLSCTSLILAAKTIFFTYYNAGLLTSKCLTRHSSTRRNDFQTLYSKHRLISWCTPYSHC